MLGYAAARDQNYFMASFVQVPYPLCNAHVAHINDILKHKLLKSKMGDKPPLLEHKHA